MAPNSLFAVLLRSPWWISLVAALVIVLLSRALLPAHLWLYGAFGCFPLVIVAGIAAWRQAHAPSAKRVEAIHQRVCTMNWRDFAGALEAGFARDGYQVERLADGAAADFQITRNLRSALVCARRWKAAKPGVDALEALRALAQERGAADCVFISLGQLSDNALRYAKANKVDVMQAPGLAQVLRALPP